MSNVFPSTKAATRLWRQRFNCLHIFPSTCRRRVWRTTFSGVLVTGEQEVAPLVVVTQRCTRVFTHTRNYALSGRQVTPNPSRGRNRVSKAIQQNVLLRRPLGNTFHELNGGLTPWPLHTTPTRGNLECRGRLAYSPRGRGALIQKHTCGFRMRRRGFCCVVF